MRHEPLGRGALLALALLAAAACRTAPPTEAASNRDRHGPADVAGYIQRLTREARVSDLQPEVVIERLELAPEARIADIGCGPGIFTLPFARACGEGVVYAVDVEPLQLDAVRTKLLAEGIDNVVPVLASHSDPHLPPGRMDVIFIADTYHHLEDRIDYLRQLRGDLAPGGVLALLEYLPGNIPVGPPAGHKLPPGQRERELDAAGFHLLRSFDTHRWHTFEVWAPR